MNMSNQGLIQLGVYMYVFVLDMDMMPAQIYAKKEQAATNF